MASLADLIPLVQQARALGVPEAEIPAWIARLHASTYGQQQTMPIVAGQQQTDNAAALLQAAAQAQSQRAQTGVAMLDDAYRRSQQLIDLQRDPDNIVSYFAAIAGLPEASGTPVEQLLGQGFKLEPQLPSPYADPALQKLRDRLIDQGTPRTPAENVTESKHNAVAAAYAQDPVAAQRWFEAAARMDAGQQQPQPWTPGYQPTDAEKRWIAGVARSKGEANPYPGFAEGGNLRFLPIPVVQRGKAKPWKLMRQPQTGFGHFNRAKPEPQEMILREPIVGVGVYSRQPKFTAAEWGREKIRNTPDGMRFDPVRGFPTTDVPSDVQQAMIDRVMSGVPQFAEGGDLRTALIQLAAKGLDSPEKVAYAQKYGNAQANPYKQLTPDWFSYKRANSLVNSWQSDAMARMAGGLPAGTSLEGPSGAVVDGVRIVNSGRTPQEVANMFANNARKERYQSDPLTFQGQRGTADQYFRGGTYLAPEDVAFYQWKHQQIGERGGGMPLFNYWQAPQYAPAGWQSPYIANSDQGRWPDAPRPWQGYTPPRTMQFAGGGRYVPQYAGGTPRDAAFDAVGKLLATNPFTPPSLLAAVRARRLPDPGDVTQKFMGNVAPSTWAALMAAGRAQIGGTALDDWAGEVERYRYPAFRTYGLRYG